VLKALNKVVVILIEMLASKFKLLVNGLLGVLLVELSGFNLGLVLGTKQSSFVLTSEDRTI